MKEISISWNFNSNFCSVKDNVKRMRRKKHRLREILVKDTSDNGLLSNM